MGLLLMAGFHVPNKDNSLFSGNFEVESQSNDAMPDTSHPLQRQVKPLFKQYAVDTPVNRPAPCNIAQALTSSC